MSATTSPGLWAFALAFQATELSQSFQLLEEEDNCASADYGVSKIAVELNLLSTTLTHFRDAITSGTWQYTQVLTNDTSEIADYLAAVFQEIAECCDYLKESGGVHKLSPIWYIMELRFMKFQRQLEVLNITLMIMRELFCLGRRSSTYDIASSRNKVSFNLTKEDENEIESLCHKSRQAIVDLKEIDELVADLLRNHEGSLEELSRDENLSIIFTTAECDDNVRCHPATSNPVTQEDAVRQAPKLRNHPSLYRLILEMDIWGASEVLQKRWVEGAEFFSTTNQNGCSSESSAILLGGATLPVSVSNTFSEGVDRPSVEQLRSVQPAKDDSKGVKKFARLLSSLKKRFKGVLRHLSKSTRNVKNQANDQAPRKSWKKRLSAPFRRSPLRDSDFDREYEHQIGF